MDFNETTINYVMIAAVAFFLTRRWLRMKMVSKQIPDLMKAGAVIVDVRSPGEYAAGSSPGSINIPLAELANRIGELDREKPLILCCASGARSGMAQALLKKQGFLHVFNAGPWTNARV